MRNSYQYGKIRYAESGLLFIGGLRPHSSYPNYPHWKILMDPDVASPETKAPEIESSPAQTDESGENAKLPKPSSLTRKKSRDDFDVQRVVTKDEPQLKKSVSKDDLDISVKRDVSPGGTSFARVRSTQLSGSPSPSKDHPSPLKKKKSVSVSHSIVSGTGSLRRRLTNSTRKRMDFTDPALDSPATPAATNKIAFIFPEKIEIFADFTPSFRLLLVTRELGVPSDKYVCYNADGDALPMSTVLGDCPTEIFFVPPKTETYVATEILPRLPKGYFSRSGFLKDRTGDESFGPTIDSVLNSDDVKNVYTLLKNIMSKKKTKGQATSQRKKEERQERRTVLDTHSKGYAPSEIRFIKGKTQIHIQATTLNTLIEILTHPIGRDKQVELDFIMSFDIVLSARELFEKMAERYTTGNVKIKENVIDFLKTLLTRRQYLFIDEPEFQSAFKKWVEEMDCAGVDQVKVKGFQLFVQSQLDGLRTKYQQSIESKLHDEDLADGPAPYPLINDGAKPFLDFLDIHPLELARQMTIFDDVLVKHIRPHEWLHQGWTKGKSPNIVACIDRFNQVSWWVSTAICLAPTVELRMIIIKYFLAVAAGCAQLSNFHCVLAMVSGFNSAPVTRLLQTWDAMDSISMKRFDQLKDIVSQDKNYKKMRKLVEVKPDLMEPCIPYIGVYLHDLIFVEDGNPDRTEDGLINFEKHELLSKHVLTMWDFSKNRYKLVPNETIQKYIKDLKVVPEDDLYEESLFRESRADNASLRAKYEKKGLL